MSINEKHEVIAEKKEQKEIDEMMYVGECIHQLRTYMCVQYTSNSVLQIFMRSIFIKTRGIDLQQIILKRSHVRIIPISSIALYLILNVNIYCVLLYVFLSLNLSRAHFKAYNNEKPHNRF